MTIIFVNLQLSRISSPGLYFFIRLVLSKLFFYRGVIGFMAMFQTLSPFFHFVSDLQGAPGVSKETLFLLFLKPQDDGLHCRCVYLFTQNPDFNI